MQVWKHLQKQLTRHSGDQNAHKETPPSPSSSSTSSVCLSDSIEQRTSASTFYVAFSDGNDDESEIRITVTKSSKHSHTMDSNLAQDHTPVNSTASHTYSDRHPTATDAKPTVQPKPNKPKKPQQQQQLLADDVANNSQKQTPGLVMCSRGTFYPAMRSVEGPVQETSSSAAKPLPPVRY